MEKEVNKKSSKSKVKDKLKVNLSFILHRAYVTADSTIGMVKLISVRKYLESKGDLRYG